MSCPYCQPAFGPMMGNHGYSVEDMKRLQKFLKKLTKKAKKEEPKKEDKKTCWTKLNTTEKALVYMGIAPLAVSGYVIFLALLFNKVGSLFH